MENLLLPHLLDASLRSLPLALAAAAILRMPKLRSAAWAHAVWSAVLLSMLALFAVAPVLKPIPLRVLPAPAAVQAAPERVAFEALAPLALPMPMPLAAPVLSTTPAPRRWSLREIAMLCYLAIAAVLFARLLVGSWLVRRLLAGSVRAGEDFFESSRVAVPLTIGWFRPAILLPASWRGWDASKLDAVLLHERAHIRRRDSLIALLAGFNRCLFWFHPLAWWLERKLAFLAEQACDEACVCALADRGEYARGAYAKLLLEMAAAVEASGGRLSGHALAMARPSQVRRRIDAILDQSRAAHRGLTAIGWAAVLLCAVPMIYAAGSMRIEPRIDPKLPRPVVAPMLLAQAEAPPPPAPRADSTAPKQRIFHREEIQFERDKITGRVVVAQAIPPAIPLDAPTTAPIPVLLPVMVTEPAGRYVTGLAVENFRITEDQVEQPVVIFKSAEGQHLIAVLDTIGDSQDAINELKKTLSPQDELIILPAPPMDSTQFRMAVIATLMELKKRPNPVKSLIVLTRGVAKTPLGPERDDRAMLEAALPAPRVSISFASVEDITETASFPPSYSLLEDLRIVAGATGGQVTTVARPEEMKTALARIGMGLRNQYLLGFVPSISGPRGLRRLNVEIVRAMGMPKMQAISPTAYIP